MHIASGAMIEYLLTHPIHYVMNAIGYGLSTEILIILKIIVITVVNQVRPQKISPYALHVLIG